MPSEALGPRRPVTPADILLSVGLFGLVVVTVYAFAPEHPRLPALTAMAAVNAAVLLAKKRFPVSTLLVCLLLAGTISATTRQPFPLTASVLIALYSVGRYHDRAVAIAVTVGTVAVGVVVSVWLPHLPERGPHNLDQIGWVPFAALLGMWVRTQRAYVLAAERRARRAENEREQEARRRVAEERVRIARELHDVVGHAIMSISVQASVGAKVVVDDPEAGRAALRTIADISGTALGEIRSTLHLLRQSGEAERGLGDLPELIGRARAAGLPVSLVQTGSAGRIPAIVGLTVYRAVQEGLTNISRHARDVTLVEVAVFYSEDEVRLTVTNDGAPVHEPVRDGIGLRGMRERVAALGGSLTTAPRPDGGFRVSVRLPLGEIPPEERW